MNVNKDLISKELREIEEKVDNFYKNNILMNLPFAVSGWYFMGFCEDKSILPLLQNRFETFHDTAAFVDNLIFDMRYPFLWLKNSCSQDGKIPFKYNYNYYKASWDLANLGENYITFTLAFTYANRGMIELKYENNIIYPSQGLHLDSRFEAYDRLVRRKLDPSDIQTDMLEEIYYLLDNSLRVNGWRFSYQLNPKIVKLASDLLLPVIKPKFNLPDNWQFSRYSISEFRIFSIALSAISFIHFYARLLAAGKGCIGLGYVDSIFVPNSEELVRRMVRYTDISEEIVQFLIEDLIYGNMNISFLDPAIQPIIKYNDYQYGIMPSLILGSNLERNFTILLNKLPSEKKVYSKLVSEKENIMRERIKKNIYLPLCRFFSGNITGDKTLPDVDLALISDIDKVCLLIELKWFIEPAEARELLEKSEEIQKGVEQLLRLSKAFNASPDIFYERLRIDSSYEIYFAVVSENSIGMKHVQHPIIPVIQEYHLIKKINSAQNLRQVIDWLVNKEYLPTEGIHFKSIDSTVKIGDWSLNWHGIEIITPESYE